jgi:hypothetical protein
MDVIKISFYSTNQNPVALYHILDDPSVKLTLFQPPTVVVKPLYAKGFCFSDDQGEDGRFSKLRQISCYMTT